MAAEEGSSALLEGKRASSLEEFEKAHDEGVDEVSLAHAGKEGVDFLKGFFEFVEAAAAELAVHVEVAVMFLLDGPHQLNTTIKGNNHMGLISMLKFTPTAWLMFRSFPTSTLVLFRLVFATRRF
jgi:hypothetical protein